MPLEESQLIRHSLIEAITGVDAEVAQWIALDLHVFAQPIGGVFDDTPRCHGVVFTNLN
jgi:hypothetical protein